MKVETIYRAVISERASEWTCHGVNHRALRPPEEIFRVNGGTYTTKTREVLAWVLDQLPATYIEVFDSDEIVATFANDTDATAFKIRWC